MPITDEQVNSRLKAAAEQEAAESEKAGNAAGVAWAQKDARPAQLRRLDAACGDNNDWGIGVGESAYTESELLYFVMEPTYNGDRRAAADFWETAAGGDALDNADDPYAWLLGFCRGAVELWHDAGV